MREEPADGDTNVLLVCPQALGPLACPSGANVRHERTEVSAPLLDVGEVLAGGEALPASSRTAPACGTSAGVNGIDRDEAVPCERVEQIEVRSSVRSATSTAASTVHPSTNTDKVASMRCSASSSSPKLHSTVARSSLPFWEVDRSAAQCIEASFQPSEQSSRLQHPVRAAASSMARGDRRRAGRSPRWQRRCRRSGRSCGGPP